MSGERMLYSVAKFIEWQSACTLRLGKSLFVGYLPTKDKDGIDMPDRCVALLKSSPGTPVPDLPDWLDPTVFQVWNRDTEYIDAHDTAWCIFDSLHGTAGWTLPAVLGGTTYDALVVNAVGDPATIENPDDKERFVFSTNYMWSISNAP